MPHNLPDTIRREQTQSKTALPVRFALDGSKTRVYESKQGHACANISPLRFDQLPLCDQEVLNGCLAQLNDHCDAIDAKQFREVMIGNPIRFYELYQEASARMHAEGELARRQEKQLAEQAAKAESKEEEAAMSLKDLDDVSIFILGLVEG